MISTAPFNGFLLVAEDATAVPADAVAAVFDLDGCFVVVVVGELIGTVWSLFVFM